MDFDAANQPDHIDIWVVEKRLGFGGMGTVYRCHNRDAPRIKAAIKVLANHLQASSTVRKRFIREAELLFELEHPHIVKVRNIRMDATPPFIEMAFVDGVSLARILKRGPLQPEDAARIVAQVASALAHCHARGVRHRDVKPANIIVRSGHATLVDFGVAIDVQGTLSQGPRSNSLGTLSYTPPEWGGKRVEPIAWDAYALGIVLYEALTGKMAFPVPDGLALRESVVQQIDVKRNTRFLDPGDEIPEVLRQLCRRLTMYEPAERIMDMGTVADTLIQWLGEAFDARPIDTHSGLVLEDGAADQPGGVTGTAATSVDARPPGVQTARLRYAGVTLAHITDDLDELLREDARPGAKGDVPRGGRFLSGRRSVLGLVGLGVVLVGAWVLLAPWLAPDVPVATAPERPPVPPVRTVQLRMPDDAVSVAAQVLFDGTDVTAATRSGEDRPVSVGVYDLEVRLGAECSDGPGPMCLTLLREVAVEAGPGVQEIAVEWPEMPSYSVTLTPEPPEDARVRVDDGPWLGARELTVARGGPVQLVLQQGTCSDEAPCGDACPMGCREVARVETLPLDPSEPVTVALALPEAVPAPQRPRRVGRGAPVTNGQLARWLKGRKQFQKANAAQVAPGKPAMYLRDWMADAPPAELVDSPVMFVTATVAEAYCASRGARLPQADAAPRTWDVSDKDPSAEYRVDDRGVISLMNSGGDLLGAPGAGVSPYTRVVCVW